MRKNVMKEYKLGDVSNNIQTGPFGSQLHQSDYSGDGTPVIMPKDFANGIISIDSIARVSGDHVNRLKQYIVKPGDIIYSRRGDVGRCALITSDNDGWLCGTGCIKVELNRALADPSYIFYRLYNQDTFNWVQQHAVGAIMPNINTSIVSEIPIKLPSLPIQRKIAAVLTALDDKIALNRRINDKLEAMAKRLYDYWFVQFDFPDENGRPYKSSGGKMVWNETLKREIPAGWEVANISKVADILPGGTPSKANQEYWNGDIPFFGPTDCSNEIFQLSTAEYITQMGLNNCSSLLYPEKTIIITARGSVGKLIVVGRPMAMNQSCYAIKPKQIEQYSYLHYLTRQLIDILKHKETGSVFKSITTSDIEHSFLSIASKHWIDIYSQRIAPVFEQIKCNTIEIASLTSLRDRLLPLLMNGQVEVN